MEEKSKQCHSQKSIHIVQEIVKSFKKERKGFSRVWINIKGRLIYIRYFAFRDRDNKYIETLEATQDISDTKKLEGEKRLLDCKN